MGSRQCQLGLTNVCRLRRPLNARVANSAYPGEWKVFCCRMLVNGVHWAQAQSLELQLHSHCALCGRMGEATFD